MSLLGGRFPASRYVHIGQRVGAFAVPSRNPPIYYVDATNGSDNKVG